MAVVTLSKIIHLIPLWRSRSESNSSLISSFSEYVSVENRVKMALFFFMRISICNLQLPK